MTLQYDTMIAAIQGLQSRGYTIDFNLAFDQLKSASENIYLKPEDFEIVESYRFEGDSNPADEDVVYAIESKDGKTKGILTSAYGMYAETINNSMLQKLSFHLHK